MPAFNSCIGRLLVYVYLRLAVVSGPRTRIFLFDPVGARMRLSEDFTRTAEGTGLADPGLQRTIEALEASFDAALEQSEEAAADDLAFQPSPGLAPGGRLVPLVRVSPSPRRRGPLGGVHRGSRFRGSRGSTGGRGSERGGNSRRNTER
jgi:hypothetical protein